MIIDLLIAAGAVTTVNEFRKIGKSLKIDEEAMHRYARSFSRSADAKRMIEQCEKSADESMLKLANRKRAILKSSIKDFLEIYQNIQNISFIEGEGIKELSSLSLSNADIKQLGTMSVSSNIPLSDKEMITSVMFKGITSTMIKDSERKLSAANNQMRAANVEYSQAETIALLYNEIKNRADRMADLLKQMNAILVKSVAETRKVIISSDNNAKNFSRDDKLVVINCINWVKGVKEILDAPLFNKDGELEKQAEEAIRIGEEKLREIKGAI